MKNNLLTLLPFSFKTITFIVLLAVFSLGIGDSYLGLGNATPDYSEDDSSDYSEDDSSDYSEDDSSDYSEDDSSDYSEDDSSDYSEDDSSDYYYDDSSDYYYDDSSDYSEDDSSDYYYDDSSDYSEDDSSDYSDGNEYSSTLTSSEEVISNTSLENNDICVPDFSNNVECLGNQITSISPRQIVNQSDQTGVRNAETLGLLGTTNEPLLTKANSALSEQGNHNEILNAETLGMIGTINAPASTNTDIAAIPNSQPKDNNNNDFSNVADPTNINKVVNSLISSSSSSSPDTAIKSNREKLIDKVSSEEELHTILEKFRNFEDSPTSENVLPADNKEEATSFSESGAIDISYSINPHHLSNPQQIVKGDYSLLMLKFTDNQESKKVPTSYNVVIEDPVQDMTVFEQKGYTNSGVDIVVIDENTFQKGDLTEPFYYQLSISIVDPKGTNIEEKTGQPIPIKVV